jgi:hypothetical protein
MYDGGNDVVPEVARTADPSAFAHLRPGHDPGASS